LSLKYWWKWEFWPFWFFYIPVYAYYLSLALRSMSLTYLTAANPGMRHGGFVDYSKNEIMRWIEDRYLPKTIYFDRVQSVETVLKRMQESRIEFPIILKPDRGERGWQVKKVESRAQIADYISVSDREVLLQEYIDYPFEYGIMYARLPGVQRGSITSVVHKEKLEVIGDGVSTLRQLFEASKRCRFHMERLCRIFASQLEGVPRAGQIVALVEIGTHSQGATFRNANHLISEELARVFDRVSEKIPGFFFGRYDVRTLSFDQLLRGQFKIIELNGTNSEPTHIYDPDNNLIDAYRDLFAHWRLMFRISRLNLSKGIRASELTDFLGSLRRHLRKKRLSSA
jgi:hypothetical protein